MCPEIIDPNVNYRRIGELAEEFTQFWKRIHALYLDAGIGFDLVRQHIDSEQKIAREMVSGSELDSEEFQNSRMFTYEQIFSGSFCASSIHEATQGEVKTRNSHGGSNYITLAQLCVVSFFDYWNDYLRHEYVVAIGKLSATEADSEVIKKALREHGSFDVWGDLGYFRNSIAHKRGRATRKVESCKLMKWFRPGDELAFSPQQMRSIFLALLKFRNEMHAKQFPGHRIQTAK